MRWANIHAEHVLYFNRCEADRGARKCRAGCCSNCGDRSQLLSGTMRAALLAWARRAELSCDRAALLVTQDQHVIGRTIDEIVRRYVCFQMVRPITC